MKTQRAGKSGYLKSGTIYITSGAEAIFRESDNESSRKISAQDMCYWWLDANLLF